MTVEFVQIGRGSDAIEMALEPKYMYWQLLNPVRNPATGFAIGAGERESKREDRREEKRERWRGRKETKTGGESFNETINGAVDTCLSPNNRQISVNKPSKGRPLVYLRILQPQRSVLTSATFLPLFLRHW
ncbi:hypothetical protein PoB_000197200 [Plakobranchus ocellatus]|uniref:Uncharacterized protein n=1 Tax=Plakobranchus ocellatus TaxID=259542 RepID=A0AAV3XYD2_9GAST|nr:hypothetical protein PoB_000197200 [Plakobranchus ocellatus]